MAARRACAGDWAPGAQEDATLPARQPTVSASLPAAAPGRGVPPPIPRAATARPSAFDEAQVIAEPCAASALAAAAGAAAFAAGAAPAVDTALLPPIALWRTTAAEDVAADGHAADAADAAAMAESGALPAAPPAETPKVAHWTASGVAAAAALRAEVPTPTVGAPPRPLRDLESGVEPDAIARLLHGALRICGALGAALAVLLLGLIVLYRFVNPPTSMLMLIQRLDGTAIHQRWVPLARIAPVLPQAVIASEDARFCYHRGVDWGELAEAIESSREGMARGGSTITMQVVKNLFLWPSRSYVRKALEIPLAYTVELLWPKRRILEVYLNVAEWGPGIFGIEAAALYHFRKPASLLTLREAALLAVSLPNPVERQAGRPGPGLLRLANRLAARMHVEASSACLRPLR